MHYSDGAFWRPLFEEDIAMLQIATGCSHNACKFCDMYHVPFTPSPLDEVTLDIDELAGEWRVPKRVFFTGGNAFHLDTAYLLQVMELVRERLPKTESFGCFARIEDVAAKSEDELVSLVEAGMSLISIGAESGDDEALLRVAKGHTAAEIIEQGKRLDAAGMTYSFFYLAGIAGKGRGVENARKTAEVFGEVNPQIIMVHTMTPFEGTVLAKEIEQGSFEQEPELEILQELREFYACYPKSVRMMAMHYANAVTFDGRVPEHREQILELMDKRIENADEERLSLFRKSVRSI